MFIQSVTSGLIVLLMLSNCCLAADASENKRDDPPRLVAPATGVFGVQSGWLDAKRDFAALGDGVTDDTTALQRALDALRETRTTRTLYIPPGTYRITRTIRLAGAEECGVVGADRDSTRIVWDGGAAVDAVAFHIDGSTYCRFARFTIDGQGNPVTAVWQDWNGKDRAPPSGMSWSDGRFRGVGIGMKAGRPHFMSAETVMTRWEFDTCSIAGVGIDSFNALDWWIWRCRFVNNAIGVTNKLPGAYGGGHVHAYENTFIGSTVADVLIGHSSYFGIRGNVSRGSAAFMVQERPSGVGPEKKGGWTADVPWGSSVHLQGNAILDPTAPTPIRSADSGTWVLTDNAIRAPAGPVVTVNGPAGGRIVAIGNRYSGPAAQAFVANGGVTQADNHSTDSITDPGDPDSNALPLQAADIIAIPAPADPGTAVDDHGELQAAIDRAAAVATYERPGVVHLPPGRFNLSATLVIPAAPVALIGEGRGTLLVGPGGGPALRIAPGPAAVADMEVRGADGEATKTTSSAISINALDVADGGLWAEQLFADGTQRGLTATDLPAARVDLRIGYPSGITVANAQVAVFGGATSNKSNMYQVERSGRLLIRDTWYEGSPPLWTRLTGEGTVTLDGGKTAPGRPGPDTSPTDPSACGFSVDGFRGHVTAINWAFETRIMSRGSAHVTSIGCNYWFTAAFSACEPAGLLAIGNSAWNDTQYPLKPVPDQGDPAGLGLALAHARATLPTKAPGAHQTRLFRVWAGHAQVGVAVAPEPPARR